MKNFSKLTITLSIIYFLSSCARGPAVKAPEWVVKGAGAFKKAEGKIFYGVGRAGPEIKDQSLRIETADNRARADLQRIFDTYSATLMKDYAGNDGVMVERAIKTFSAGHLSGVQIVDHYFAPDGTVNSLAELNLETFKKAMELAKELSDAAKEYIRQKADALFEELEKEEAKRAIR